MNRFDFTKFTNEKWHDVITYLLKDPFYDIVMVWHSSTDGEPCMIVHYGDKDDFECDKCNELMFTAFNVGANSPSLTYKWRKFMIKEFGEEYRKALVEYLEQEINLVNNM